MLVAFLVLVLAGSTRVGWLLLFDAVLWGALAISAVMPWLAGGKLDVRRRVVGWDGDDDAPGPTEGRPVEFEVTLHNRGMLPCMLLSVDLGCGGETVEPGKEKNRIVAEPVVSAGGPHDSARAFSGEYLDGPPGEGKSQGTPEARPPPILRYIVQLFKQQRNSLGVRRPFSSIP